jgi:hypothetical protein
VCRVPIAGNSTNIFAHPLCTSSPSPVGRVRVRCHSSFNWRGPGRGTVKPLNLCSSTEIGYGPTADGRSDYLDLDHYGSSKVMIFILKGIKLIH